MSPLRPRLGRVASLCATVALLATGCGGDPVTSTSSYSYDPSSAPVKVDTAELREQKAQAAIDPCPRTDPGTAPVKGGLPAITLPCLGGGRGVDLAGLTGQPTLVNFWAQTCGPCRHESPLLQQLHETGAVRVIGVDFYDALPDRAIAFADELGLTYPQVADPEAATRAPLRISGLPMTILVDASGKIRHVEYGPVHSASDLATLVATYLDVHPDLG